MPATTAFRIFLPLTPGVSLATLPSLMLALLQQLLDAVLNPVLVLQKRHAQPRQISEFALPLGRNEAPLQQNALQQFGQPGGVDLIRLLGLSPELRQKV